MARQGLFVLGVGAQKAGTSWLRWYLQRARNADMGMMKEYHVWDASLLSLARDRRVDATMAAQSDTAALRHRMQADPEVYFDYFAERLAPRRISVTGDITPLYGGLPAGTFRQISEGFASRGIACKAVFLMRDPVQRCCSQARMIFARGETGHDTVADFIETFYQGADAQLRTRYDHTIKRLEAALPRQDLYLGPYENIAYQVPLKRLSEFCGVRYRPGLARHVVRPGAQTDAIPEALMRDMARHFAPVYAFCRKRWPRTEQLWSGFAHL